MGNTLKTVSIAIYGVTLVLLYSISTVYHSVRGPRKKLLRKLDHLSIYLLIAGSYTPFCLVTGRRLGLEPVRRSVDAGGHRHGPGDKAAQRGAGVVDRDLRGDGLDRR